LGGNLISPRNENNEQFLWHLKSLPFASLTPLGSEMTGNQTNPAVSELVRQTIQEPDIAVDLRKDLLLLSIIIFAVAALLPAATIPRSGAHSRQFIWGWMCIVIPITPAWFANPFLWLAWICGYFRHSILVCVSCAIALLLSVLALGSLRSTGGPPASFSIGYFFWIFSMLLALGSGIVGVTHRKDQAAE
jgi:hypothetical protein